MYGSQMGEDARFSSTYIAPIVMIMGFLIIIAGIYTLVKRMMSYPACGIRSLLIFLFLRKKKASYL